MLNSPTFFDPNQELPKTNTNIISKLSHHTHQQKLKNSKRVYDQLHNNRVHTFIVRKKHLEKFQKKYQQTAKISRSSRQNQNMAQKFQQVVKINRAHSLLPSIPSQQYLQPKSRSHPKAQRNQQQDKDIEKDKQVKDKTNKSNIDVIKKMLQINRNFHNNFNRNNKSINQITFRNKLQSPVNNIFLGQSNDFTQNLDKLSSGKRSSMLINNEQNFERPSRNSQFIKYSRQQKRDILQEEQKNMFYSQIKQVISNIKQQHKKSNFPKSLNKQKKNQNTRSSYEKLSKRKQRLLHTSNSPPPNSNSITTYNYLSLQSYIKFINAPEQIRQLHIQFNFSSLRKLTANQAWKNLDIKNAKLIESLLQNLLIGLQDPSETSVQFIKDCCRLYFNNYQKAKLQIILKQHYFKLFAFKLNPMFVYQRIVIYFCYILAQKNNLQNSWFSVKVIALLKLLQNLYSSIINIITQMEITKHSLQTLMNTTATGSSGMKSSRMPTANNVDQTFQILRTVSEMERNIGELEKIIGIILENGTIVELNQIDKQLKPYLNEQSYGIGAKSYENFIKTQMLLSWRYMQVPPTPFLPPIGKKFRYTLVLDLDQTIIYYNQQTNILRFRPGLDLFFKKLQSLQFEIVLFTASSKTYAGSIVKQIQRTERIFEYRLYKEHLSLYQGKLIKDLRRIGRDMSKTILIDDLNVNFISCQENGIEVSSWEGNREDRQLMGILAVLVKLETGDYVTKALSEQEQHGYTDVRKLLKAERKRLQSMLQSSQANQS